MSIKIDDLKIVTAVFSAPNLTKVAQHYHLSQSNLSKIIKRIEDELGFQLFERKGFQGLHPTPQGVLFFKRMQKFNRSWEDTLALVKNFDQQKIDIKVTGPSLYMRNIFLPIWFESPLPEKFRLTYIQSRFDEISLTAQASDIDVLITPSPFELDDWVPLPIFTEKFAIFTSQKKKPEVIKDLKISEKFWIAYRASSDLLHSFLRQQQIPKEKIIAYIDDVESILDIIQKRSDLLALLPAHAGHSFKQLNSFQLNQGTGQKLYLMYRSGDKTFHACIQQLSPILKKANEVERKL